MTVKKASRAILAVTSALTFVLGVRSSTYLQDTTDAVALDVDFAALADGTTYPATVKPWTPRPRT